MIHVQLFKDHRGQNNNFSPQFFHGAASCRVVSRRVAEEENAARKDRAKAGEHRTRSWRTSRFACLFVRPTRGRYPRSGYAILRSMPLAYLEYDPWLLYVWESRRFDALRDRLLRDTRSLFIQKPDRTIERDSVSAEITSFEIFVVIVRGEFWRCWNDCEEVTRFSIPALLSLLVSISTLSVLSSLYFSISSFSIFYLCPFFVFCIFILSFFIFYLLSSCLFFFFVLFSLTF